MTVYVDDMYLYPMGQYRGMKMSHMAADTTEELLVMVRSIGVDEKWIQHKGTSHEHFDIALSKRERAVRLGAVEVTMKDMARMMRGRKKK